MKHVPLSTFFLALFMWCSSVAHAVELTLAHYGSDTHPSHHSARVFAENVAKRTGNAVTVTILPQSIMGGPHEILAKVVEGSLDMCLAGQNYLSSYAKMFDVVTIPFSLDSYEHADRVLDSPEFVRWATRELEKVGLIYLSRWEWGFRQISNSVRPINGPEDMAGLLFRTPPALASKATLEAFGATVTTIPFDKLVPTMRGSVVDGQENPLGVIYNLRLYETQKYLCLLNFLYTSMNHVVAAEAWQQLTFEQQQIIREESAKAGLVMRNKVRVNEVRQLAEMRSRGAVVTTPNAAAFKKLIGPVHETIKKEVGEKSFARWMKLVDSFR